jgi:hypothetical protein
MWWFTHQSWEVGSAGLRLSRREAFTDGVAKGDKGSSPLLPYGFIF